MSDGVYNVLFLCTHNSARSIIAEAVLNKDGAGRFRAFSAGNQPSGRVNPLALKVLQEAGYPTAGVHSKAWDVFAAPGAPFIDLVVTVCDDAAGEACPIWPGRPVTAHWGIEDPSRVQGAEIEREAAFVTALRYLKTRISLLVNLQVRSLDQLALASRVREIGRGEGATARASESA